MMVFCNCIAPLIWWIPSMRRNLAVLFVVSIIINIGMWFERYNIIASALAHQFDPASWTYYSPSWVEMGIMVGSFGWFGMWFTMFIKIMPSVAVAEIKELVRPPLKSDQLAAK
jgi:molybdopterin-containing oxidoreductase family membrane subunit